MQMSHDVFATTGECLTNCGTNLGPSQSFGALGSEPDWRCRALPLALSFQFRFDLSQR
jgi:hypothetical protein